MQDVDAIYNLVDFAERYEGVQLQSTAATVVNFAGILYNVIGSTHDPKIDGADWKQLLRNNGIGAAGTPTNQCYATAPPADPVSSHNAFSVGGHVTVNADGSVTGGTCYLMPLCSWHNNSARNGMPFNHVLTQMLRLSGYMQAEPAATFLARMPSAAPYRLVSVEGSQLINRELHEPQVLQLKAEQPQAEDQAPWPEHYLLFRQIHEGGETRYVIEDKRLPNQASS
ncbi:hypothetical protein ACQZ4Q_04110 [Agrobacterium vitis]|uniref:hypothetical protein n=1 Tax=Agrobacterium vitis TaxID=373 RepID=UPI003D2A92F4